MIDSQVEQLMSLTEAAKNLPARRRGKRPHVSCLYRWTAGGCKGVILESIEIGGTRCTSQEALSRFFERLTAVKRGEPIESVQQGRTLAQRQRASEAAEKRLIEMGA